jgi:hypothetical protein
MSCRVGQIVTECQTKNKGDLTTEGNTPRSSCVNSFSHGLNHTVWKTLRSCIIIEDTRCSDIMVLADSQSFADFIIVCFLLIS